MKFLKMWNLLGMWGFERELQAVKDGWVRKNWSVIENKRRQKKETAHSEVGWSRTVSAKMGVFRPLFGDNCFGPIWPYEHPPRVIHYWKATDLPFLMVNRKILVSPCAASDFRWRSWTDFLHDLRLPHNLNNKRWSPGKQGSCCEQPFGT